MSENTLKLIKWGSPILAIPLVLSVTFLFLRLSSMHSRIPIEYLIPRNYVGWIRIEYGLNDYPALPHKDGHVVAGIPSTGILRTSSKPEYGWAVDKYYYLDQTGKRLLLPHNINADGMVHPFSAGEWGEETFIGTKAQLKSFGWSHSGRPVPIKIPKNHNS